MSSVCALLEAGAWDEPATLAIAEKACQVALSHAPEMQGLSEAEREAIAVSLVFTDDAHIKALNHDYREKDKPTNVLSFPNYDSMEALREEIHQPWNAEGVALGDIILAFETIAREAEEQGKPFAHHLTHLVVHGTLHLLGYDHEEEREAADMEALEIEILQQLSIANPYEIRI